MASEMRRAGAPLLIALAAVLAPPACSVADIDAPAEGTVFVSIGDDFFKPETVTVALGGSVRWTNDGKNVHAVVSDTGLYQSELISPTWWFEARFDSLGTFPYHCSLHQEQTGTVVVQ